MSSAVVERVRQLTSRVSVLLEHAREALRGRRRFGPEDVQAIRAPISEMAPIMADAERLRLLQPELDGSLKEYRLKLGELRETLIQVRLLLIARRANLQAARGHLETIALWAEALKRTT